jgi:hypothetical protein
MGDAAAQQQAQRLRHQHQFDRQVRAGGNRGRVLEVDAAFGDDHRLRLADSPSRVCATTWLSRSRRLFWI